MSEIDEREIKLRFEVISRFELSPEVTARDLKRARKALVEQINRQPAGAREIWRIIVRSRLTKLAAAAVIIGAFGLYVFFGDGQATLYAQVMEAFEQARTIYAVGYTFEEGRRKKASELRYQRGLGLRTEELRSGKTRTRLDNGRYEWEYVQGNDFAVQIESTRKMELPGEITEPSRYLKKCTRDPAGDMEVDGSFCMLYTRTHPAQAEEPVVKSMMWIDDRMRFRRYEEQQLLAGTWQTIEVVSISYDIPIDPGVFLADFGPEVRILKAQDSIENLFPLEGAVAKKEVMGLVFAVHELKRSGDYVFTTVSIRPTDDTRNQLRSHESSGDQRDFKHYGDIYLTSWWERKANGDLEQRPYAHTMLGYYQVDDVLVRCFASLPKGEWPGVDDEFELSVRISPMGELRNLLREKGRQSQTQVFRPLFTLPLPAEDTPVEQVAWNLYETAKLIAPLRPTRLEPRPSDITSDDLATEVERKLTGLRPMTELWQSVGSEVVVKLSDEDGQPVAGAKIGSDIRSLDGRLHWYSQNERRDCAVSDADGKVVLQGPQMFGPGASRQNSCMLFAVQQARQVAGVVPITDEEFGKTVTLTMRPACRVHGRFVCPELSDNGDALNRPLKTHLSFFAEKMMYRILYHTTNKQVFEALLVPGKYSMSCESLDANRKWIARAGQLLDVPAGQEELDLGEIVLRLEDYR
jgi:hypothetical protein